MGCICAKPSAANDSKESLEPKQFNNRSLDLRVASSRNEEKFGVKDKLRYGELSGGLIDKKGNNSRRVRDDHHEKKISDVVKHPSFGSIPKSMEGEQVAAGWPSWLAIAAGVALKGWLPRSANTFQRLDKIGQGTYSSVYKARDLTNKKVVALKRVRFDIMDPESIKFMAREIIILRRLDHPNVIKLEGLVTSRSSCSLYLVFEYMEHDLMGLASLPGVKFTEPQVKCYVHQLLSGLDHCHSRGVLHRDVKGSNLLIDNHGVLKIADFGLASFFYHHQSVPLTSRVVTLWYRPPELLLGATDYGVQVDLWSTGCILGELYAGKPIMPGRTEVEQLHKIFKLCGSPSEEYWAKSKLPHSTVFKPVQPYRRRLAETFKNFPAAAIGLMDTLLSIDPAQRGTAAFSLKSQFFRTEPLACDPSSLPKYPPSKEIDAKMREEASRRQGAVAVRGQRVNCDVRGSNELKAVRAPVSIAELSSMQRKQNYLNLKSQSELYDLGRNESASCFPIDPPRQTQAVKVTRKDFVEHPSKKVLHSGPLVSGVGREKVEDLYADISVISTGAELATLSGLVASRSVPSEECPDKLDSLSFEASNELGKLSVSSQERTRKPDRKHRSQNNMGSHRAANGRSSTKEPVLYGHVLKGKKIHFSGPLVPSSNVDQMLREHERHIQEAARRARIEKTRPGKFQAHGMQTMADPVCAASHG